MSRFIIYGLVDPRTDEVRYIGKSESGLTRPRHHGLPSVNKRDNTYKGNWIRSLIAAGVSYEISVLQVLEDKTGLVSAEIEWITRGRSLGWNLTNLTNGGDGRNGFSPSEESRAKARSAMLGRSRPDLSRIMTGRKLSPETRARISAAKMGYVPSAEHRASLSAAGMGRKMSAESIAKTAAALLGRKKTKEQREASGRANKGRRWTAETRMKVLASRKARQLPRIRINLIDSVST